MVTDTGSVALGARVLSLRTTERRVLRSRFRVPFTDTCPAPAGDHL